MSRQFKTDDREGHLIDEKCPYCGSYVLADGRGNKWCSFVECTWFLYGSALDDPGPAYMLGRATDLEVTEWYKIAGHVTPCPKCGKFLTSLYLCGDCNQRYDLQELSRPTTHAPDLATALRNPTVATALKSAMRAIEKMTFTCSPAGADVGNAVLQEIQELLTPPSGC